MTNLLTRLFVKNYHNTSDPVVRRRYGVMVSVVGMILNLLLFAAKLTVGILFASLAVKGDAINNLSDAGTLLVSLIAFCIAAKPADRKHPHGHGRMEYVASLALSFIILKIGIDLFLESVGQIPFAAPPKVQTWGLAVLALSVLLKVWLAFFNRKIGKKINSSVMKATFADCLSDAASTSGVLLSSLILLAFPNLPFNLDACVGTVVAVLIVIAGIRILCEANNLILGEAPSEETLEQIRTIASGYPEILGIHDLEVHSYGPSYTVATFHAEMDGKADVFQSHEIIDTVERRLERECDIHATVHMDPVVTDSPEIRELEQMTRREVLGVRDSFRIHDFRTVRCSSYIKLIFDVEVPYEEKWSDREIKDTISDRISHVDASYFAVITVDRV